MKILISRLDDNTHRTFFTEEANRRISSLGEVTEGRYDREGLKDALEGQDVLFCGWGRPVMDDDFLSCADKLRMVLYTGGSVADFVTDALWRRGIRVASGNRLYAQSVAEGTVGYILLAQRRLPKIIRETEENGWAAQYRTDGIRYKTVGLIGYGMIVRELLPMLKAFGCRIKVCSDWYTPDDAVRYGAEKCGLDEIFKTCDIVSLHESLRDDTYHLIDGKYFDMMREDSLFINTARGPIVVESDLAKAAGSGRIRAVLDVYDREPLPMDSPLRGKENIILIPHRGGPTFDVREQVTLALCDDLERYIAGEKMLCEIDPEYAANMTKETLRK